MHGDIHFSFVDRCLYFEKFCTFSLRFNCKFQTIADQMDMIQWKGFFSVGPMGLEAPCIRMVLDDK